MNPTTTIVPPGTYPGTDVVAQRQVVAQSRRWITPSVAYIYFLWFVVILDPHRWLAERGPHITAMNGALPILALPLVPMLLIYLPRYLGRANRTVWYLPFLGFVLVTAVTIPSAIYPQLAWDSVKIFLVYYLLVVATFIFVRKPRQVIPLLILYAGQYWWWGWHSGLTGAVWWHPTLANSDTYGPLMLIGIPITFCFGLAAKSKVYRYGGFFLAAYCSLAVVTAFARGVALSFVAVALLLWLRSPYKGKTTVALVGSVATILIASALLFPNNGFWKEINTSFTEGTEEGTGNDRWELWKAGMKVFETHPVFGVGAEHFGHYAYRMVLNRKLEMGGVYSWLTQAIQGRQLHSIYVQVLAEHGIAGALMLLLMIGDFWRRNIKLRTKEHRAYWYRAVRGRFDLRLLALGLEGAMVAYLTTGVFYAQFYQHWFFSIAMLNILLYTFSKPPATSVAPARRAPRTQLRRA